MRKRKQRKVKDGWCGRSEERERIEVEGISVEG